MKQDNLHNRDISTEAKITMARRQVTVTQLPFIKADITAASKVLHKLQTLKRLKSGG